MFAPLKLEKANQIVFMPINDSTSPGGGTHWTLLVRMYGQNYFYLDPAIGYDGSKTKSNYMHTNVTDTARKLATLCGADPAKATIVQSLSSLN